MTASRLIPALACAGLLALSATAPPAALADETIDVTGRERIVDGLIPVTGAEQDSARLDLRIRFEVNAATLTEAGRRQLDELANALASERLADIRVGLHGHTDASGPADYNLKLSQGRAESARKYLIEQHGIAPTRLDAAGFGERRLRPDLAPEAAGQRRVEVINLTPDRVRPAGTKDAGHQNRTSPPENNGDGTSAITQ
jgi:outer membrane protein OmpA-like peptidoglycan-associated protein